jgi:hypothetical protein
LRAVLAGRANERDRSPLLTDVRCMRCSPSTSCCCSRSFAAAC